jgi:large repetitive protein
LSTLDTFQCVEPSNVSNFVFPKIYRGKMRRIFNSVGLLLFITFSVIPATAQDGGSSTITIKVREAYNALGNRATPTWKVNSNCVWRNGNGWMYFDQPVGIQSGYIQNNFSVSVDSWQEDSDCSDRCNYEDKCRPCSICPRNDSDDGRAQWSVNLNLSGDNNDNNTSGYPVEAPGKFYDLPKDFLESSYGLRLSVSYSTPQPKRPEINEGGGASYTGRILCNTEQVTVVPLIHVNPIHHSQISYKWEYHIKGDSSNHTRRGRCLEYEYEFRPPRCILYERIPYKLPIWKTYTDTNGGADGGKKTFSLNDIPELKNLKASTQIFFRVTASANGSASPISLSSIAINVSPSGPSVPPSGISTLPSCSVLASANGQINVNGVSAPFPSYLYLLKQGFNAALGCDPENPSSCLTPGSISGSATTANFIISNVAAGAYTLFLLNPAGSAGLCSTTSTNIEVSPIAPLLSPAPAIINVACQGSSSGAISFTVNTGKPNNVSHTLTSASGLVFSKISTNAGEYVSFGSLPKGVYELTINDGCSPSVKQSNISISQPVKVKVVGDGSVASGAATCLSPGNGTARIDVEKSTDTPTSSQFHYRLFGSNGVMFKEAILTEPSFNMTDLPVDNYTIIAKELGALDCNAATGNFSISGPTLLGISDIIPTSTLCDGSTDGKLLVTGNSGVGSYEIATVTGGAIQQNTSGSFTNLASGDYRITLRRAVAGCSDKYEHPIPVTIIKPSKVSVLLNKQNISCYGLDNGTISATSSGGTPASGNQYTYSWEMQTGSNWSTLPNAGGTVTSLRAGNYRVRVEDANRCPQTSTDERIIEPPLLQISNVAVSDIKCFGETGTIALATNGGTGTANYQYSVDGGTSYKPFSSATPLNSGTYKLKAIDQNGCEANGATNYSITSPPSALTFSQVLSDYNGLAVSCFGGKNGSIKISPNGGNGATYSGYTYALNSGSFNANSLIENLAAGTYNVKVKDGRGCVMEKSSIQLTQSTEQIDGVVIEKKDVLCADEKTGILEITGKGGLSPYRYALTTNALTLQDNARFTGLEAGEYTIKIVDKNNCSVDYKNTIASGSPRIQLTNIDVTDIKCLGDKGYLNLSANGGSAPLTFEYAYNGANTFSTFTRTTPLDAGNYSVRVKDSKGCSIKPPTTFSITQPNEPLRFTQTRSDYNSYSISCFGGDNGSVTLQASGGNGATYKGYFYTIDSKPYSENGTIDKLTAGSYTVKAKDGRGCEVKETISITQPSQALATTLKSKKDVVCAGDKKGLIEIQAVGGITPYQFTLDNLITQSNGSFTALEAGNYTITVKDKNQCESVVRTSITSTNAAPVVVTKTTSVNCFGENNGAINVSLTGGSPPFKYQWAGSTKTTPNLSDLTAGVYTLKITDNVGCEDDFEIELKQPNPLQMDIDVKPSCFGQSTGEILISPKGGVAPYQYATAGNNSFQSVPTFASLPAGDHAFRIKDANKCLGDKTIKITEKNGKNEPNFLVSTKRYASDTLVAVDISVPKPDSIDWIFDPRIVVVKPDKWSPQMLFKEAGSFVMSMKGHYEGCDYLITKTLTINPYDPDAAILKNLSRDKAIQEFAVFPNPSVNGNVKLSIKLGSKQYISVSIIDLMGLVRQTYKWDKVKEVSEAMVLENIVIGLYVVRVVTETDVRELRLIID